MALTDGVIVRDMVLTISIRRHCLSASVKHSLTAVVTFPTAWTAFKIGSDCQLQGSSNDQNKWKEGVFVRCSLKAGISIFLT
jgi:hypothetical protein